MPQKIQVSTPGGEITACSSLASPTTMNDNIQYTHLTEPVFEHDEDGYLSYVNFQKGGYLCNIPEDDSAIEELGYDKEYVVETNKRLSAIRYNYSKRMFPVNWNELVLESPSEQNVFKEISLGKVKISPIYQMTS